MDKEGKRCKLEKTIQWCFLKKPYNLQAHGVIVLQGQTLLGVLPPSAGVHFTYFNFLQVLSIRISSPSKTIQMKGATSY